MDLSKKWIGGVAIFLCLVAFGMALTNLTTFARGDFITMGAGMYLFLIFPLVGLSGAAAALT